MSKIVNTSSFIEKARKTHGDKYDYSKVIYKKAKEKVCIICPIHGEFWQMPSDHLKGRGCRKCGNKKNSILKQDTIETFIKKAKKVHGDKYLYTKSIYKHSQVAICITCLVHGDFWQIPSSHLSGCGCPKCGLEERVKKQRRSNAEFIEKARKIHGDKYDYSKVEYTNSSTKVCIICPIHGEFWQQPNHHLEGGGCPQCKKSVLEKEIEDFLREHNILLEQQKKFKWLGRQSLDFYLPEYNVAIECQGIQHFQPIDFFGGEKHFKYVLELDKRKKKLCEENGVKILYYSKTNSNQELIINKEEILENIQIKNHEKE